MMRSKWICAFGLSLALVSAQAVEVAGEKDGVARSAPPTRVSDQPTAVLNALKQNDFAGLLEATESDKDLAEIAKQWNEQAERQRKLQAKWASEQQDPAQAELALRVNEEQAQLWAKLQHAEGVDALVDEFQPKVAEAVSQHLLTFNLGFGAMLTEISRDQNLTAAEAQQLTQLMIAVQNWTARVDFADRERLRRALTAVSHLVRQTKAKSFDETQTLPFEEAVVHGDAMLATVKKVLAAYDVDVDQILNSVRFSEFDVVGDRATLHATATVFGVDLSHDFKMRYYGDEWIPIEMAEVRENLDPELEGAEAAVAKMAAADAATAAEASARASPDAKRESSSGSCGEGAEFDIEIDAATKKSNAESR
jgi:Skp family chaperone for outer membrane proteins